MVDHGQFENLSNSILKAAFACRIKPGVGRKGIWKGKMAMKWGEQRQVGTTLFLSSPCRLYFGDKPMPSSPMLDAHEDQLLKRKSGSR